MEYPPKSSSISVMRMLTSRQLKSIVEDRLSFLGDYHFITPLSATGKKKMDDLYLSGKAGVIAASDPA